MDGMIWILLFLILLFTAEIWVDWLVDLFIGPSREKVKERLYEWSYNNRRRIAFGKFIVILFWMVVAIAWIYMNLFRENEFRW